MFMDYGADARLSKNTITGIGLVVLLHIFLVYALLSGLGTRVFETVHPPLNVVMITQPKQVIVPPPPHFPQPTPDAPHYDVPMPPVHREMTVPPQMPPAGGFVYTPRPPTAGHGTVSTNVGIVCPGVTQMQNQLSDEFGQISDQTGINSASVVLRFTVGVDGKVSNMTIVSSSAPQLDALALQGGALLNCHGQGQAVTVTAPFAFTSD
jgi:protein TonB